MMTLFETCCSRTANVWQDDFVGIRTTVTEQEVMYVRDLGDSAVEMMVDCRGFARTCHKCRYLAERNFKSGYKS